MELRITLADALKIGGLVFMAGVMVTNQKVQGQQIQDLKVEVIALRSDVNEWKKETAKLVFRAQRSERGASGPGEPFSDVVQ